MKHHSGGDIDRVLDALGHTIGMGPLQLDAERRLVLDLEPGGLVLLIQDLEDGGAQGLMVAVSGPCDWLRPELATHLLKQAGFRRHGAQPLRWIWNSGRLWVSVRLPHAGLLPVDLEQAIHRLSGEVDAIAERV